VEIPVSLWGGHLIFLHLDRVGAGTPQREQQQEEEEGEAAPAAALGHLAPLLERLEGEHGFSAGMRHVARRTYSVNCNWKVRGEAGLYCFRRLISIHRNQTLRPAASVFAIACFDAQTGRD
jgi:hypothetical protein